jgi:hypothetical protein
MTDDTKAKFYARTMHTPDDPPRAELRGSLRDISKILIPLHRALIENAKADYSFEVAPVEGPNHLMKLITDDPYFAWLKPITSLIVDIDEMARVDFTTEDAHALLQRVEALFATSRDDAPDDATVPNEFAAKYLPILQRDVDVTISHAALRNALSRIAR